MRPWQDAMASFEEKIEKVKETASSDRVRQRLDTELGIFLIKNAGTLFYFDKQVRMYEREIKELARNGEKDEAIEVAKELKGYITYQLHHNRYYKSRMKTVSKHFEERGEKFIQKARQLQGSRLVQWIQKMNTRDAEEFEEVLDGIDDEAGDDPDEPGT